MNNKPRPLLIQENKGEFIQATMPDLRSPLRHYSMYPKGLLSTDCTKIVKLLRFAIDMQLSICEIINLYNIFIINVVCI